MGLIDVLHPGRAPRAVMAPADRQGELLGGTPRSFAAPGRGEGRIGVVDAGSNSVRLVVFEGGRRSPAILFNEKLMAGLGASLARTGRLDPEGRTRAMAALTRFAAVAELLHVGALAGIATAAIRDAEDGPAFRDEVEERTGIRLDIVSGEDEARLAAQGVLFGMPEADGVAVDLGGASLEFCRIDRGRVGAGVSTPLGPLRLMGLDGGARAVGAEIDRHLGGLDRQFRLDGGRLYLVGGSWRALARVQMERSKYPMKLLHEFCINVDDARALGRSVARQTPKGLARIPGLSASRADVLPMSGRLFAALVEALAPGEIVVSGFGLREGVCLANLGAPLRPLDPLLAAARAQERARARAPGFGAELGEWVLRVLEPTDAEEARLIRAASHLADVNWRSHPDYRVDGCWDSVTRSTITNIGHRGRALLGAALTMRYRRARSVLGDYPALRLLDEAELDRAVQIGLALRAGCTIAGAAPGVLPGVGVSIDSGTLVVTLPPERSELAGEEVEKRLAHLAEALGLASRLEVAKG
ncbi:MAG TPA: Ppx/GppA family phosphatase [Thermohalobaculum sp.]|nr:Ppx/GppA family phosphatase [Thermohalobaculum sp.]